MPDPPVLAAIRPQQDDEEFLARVAPLKAGDDGQDLPRRGQPAEVIAAERTETEKMARTFAMEYLTGHYRPLRDDEQQRYDQLVVVMLAFAANIRSRREK